MMKRGDSRKNALPGEESLAQLLQEAASIQCTPVVGELWHMVYYSYSRRQAENIVELEMLLSLSPILTDDEMSAREYGRIRAEMRQQGITLPPVDTMIAAIARVHDLIVLTSDSDFSCIPHLKVDNWLNSS